MTNQISKKNPSTHLGKLWKVLITEMTTWPVITKYVYVIKLYSDKFDISFLLDETWKLACDKYNFWSEQMEKTIKI